MRRLEGDLSSLQDTVKSYADEVRDGVVKGLLTRKKRKSRWIARH